MALLCLPYLQGQHSIISSFSNTAVRKLRDMISLAFLYEFATGITIRTLIFEIIGKLLGRMFAK